MGTYFNIVIKLLVLSIVTDIQLATADYITQNVEFLKF